MRKTSALLLLTLGAFGCAGSATGDAAQPESTATAEATAEASASADIVLPPPAETSASATAATSTAPPTASAAPPAAPLPEAFVKVQGPFLAMMTKLADDTAASGTDCKQLVAVLNAFLTDKTHPKTLAAYKAEEAKLPDDQRNAVYASNDKLSGKMMDPVMKCSVDKVHQKAVSAASDKMMKMLERAKAGGAASAAPAGSATAKSAPPAKSGPPAKQ